METNMTSDDYYYTTNTSEGGFFDPYTNLRKSLHTMSLVIYCLVFVFGVLGNGVVIWVTGFKMKKTVNTVWFLNLAVADFLFTVLLPLGVTYLVDFHWPFGNFMCKLYGGVNSVNMFASVYILVAISVDRCVSVVWPIWAKNHRTVRKASYVSLGAWILALILSSPYFAFRDTILSFEGKINCFTNYVPFGDDITLFMIRYQIVTINRFILAFVVPFTVIVSCYAVIIQQVRRSPTLASQSSRPIKIITAVISAFFLCWAPFHIMVLIEMVNLTSSQQSAALFYAVFVGLPITTSLAFLNSCLNPLLYVFMGHDFKDKVRKSILSVLENVFQEEETSSPTDTTSAETGPSKEISDFDMKQI